MKVFDKVKIDISELTSSMEMVGYLDALKLKAVLYCLENHPGEFTEPKEVSITGFKEYLDSEI